MSDVVILSAARTAIGAFQGAFRDVPAPRLGARALAGAIERAGLAPTDIEQVYLGCVLTAGIGQAPARQAALAAGCPESTGAITFNKVCGSAMRAVMSAANDLRAGDFRIVAAGGMENMSRAPYLALGARDGLRLGHGQFVDSMIHDGLWDPYGDKHMGNCAELCVAKYEFTREQQDDYSRRSYARARAAQESGAFAREIVPVEIEGRKGTTVIDRDEEPFKVDLEKMATLRPAFDKAGTVTAANASKIDDGAAVLVLSTAEEAARRGLRPIARLVAQASHAQAPDWFTTAPVAAMRKALDRAGLAVGDIDLFEINEAFAVVAMACARELGIPDDRLNVRGGAVALGHPIGASGARILVTLLDALAERGGRYGCAGICIGGGEATSVVVERLPG
ncbi:MAG: acetyl-CoA C-acyltransferase [Thermoanaerobaculia bacterium]|nr:MAG: acetyl-CoA C-acyltransferase [Thermoanaerobaculia bacterium]MBZ0101697.1 acetyl-CoA C-acyltransferase [Thermoanaerobaculia bacterium]